MTFIFKKRNIKVNSLKIKHVGSRPALRIGNAFPSTRFSQEGIRNGGGSTRDLGLLTPNFKDKLFHSHGDIAGKLVFTFVCICV